MIPRTLLLSALLSGAALLPSQASLVAYYPLDGDFQDASGNGNHGTLVGGNTGYSNSVPASIGGDSRPPFPGPQAITATSRMPPNPAVWR